MSRLSHIKALWRTVLAGLDRTPDSVFVTEVVNAPLEASLDTPLPDTASAVGGPLTAINPYSPTWLFVRSWAETELKKAREKNDSINKDITQTAVLRGEIKILKELINLPNPRKGLLSEGE